MGRCNFFLRSPKKEQQVPDSDITESSEFKDALLKRNVYKEIDIMEELEGILSIDVEEMLAAGENMCGYHEWNFKDREKFPIEEVGLFKEEFIKEEDDECGEDDNTIKCLEARHHYSKADKEDISGLEEEEEAKSISLNLSLNYQEVLDAWSDRGSLWADDHSLSMANKCFMGEVPVMEEERTRREASVLRYKEKRQNRLFSKKIRYEVRKLNADKRPRLKGRFVKRVPDKYLNGHENISTCRR